MPTTAEERAKIRSALLRILKEDAKQTSFSRLLTTSLYDVAVQNQTTAKQAKAKAIEAAGEEIPNKTKAEPKVRGASRGNLDVFQPNGFYHSVELDFALGRHPGSYVDKADNYNNSPDPPYTDDEKENWGTGFGNPLVNPKKDCIYIVRARIDQLRADPMIGGFKLRWRWPSDWTPVDKVSRVQLVECSSNPLYVQRLFKSNATAITNNGVFACKIIAWYP